jgi:hypothetical protein
MNAFSPIVPLSSTPDWDGAQKEVHLWLGHCLDCFTQAESKVAEALLLLARSFPKCVKLGKAHSFGHKLQLLREVLESQSALEAKRARLALQSLDRFQPFVELRNHVCHGAMTVYLTRDGRWLVELKLVQLTSSTITTSQVMIDPCAAQVKLNGLRSVVQSLSAQLTNLCASLDVQEAPTPSAPEAQASG